MMQLLAKIGQLAQRDCAFKAAAARVLQSAQMRPHGRVLVEKNRNAEALVNLLTGMTSQLRSVRSRLRPEIGTKGTTSAAPIRGWTPRCLRRSISSTALAVPAIADSTTSSGG
jgi:hypothetical protein